MGVKAVKVFFNGWVVVIGVLSLAVAFIISSADRIDPEIYVWHQYPVMFSPLIVLFNFSLLVYWLVRRKFWAIIPVLALVLNLRFITSIVGLNFGENDVNNFTGKKI